jgi:hypothetical protein
LVIHLQPLVLNPTLKDVYFRTRWSEEEYQKGMKALEEVVNSFSGFLNSFLTILSCNKYHAAGEADTEIEVSAPTPTAVQPPPFNGMEARS